MISASRLNSLHKNMGNKRFYTRLVTKDRIKYFDGQNRVEIRDRAVIDRLNKLRVPPGYHDVIISQDPGSKIQAISLDDRGRKQYTYNKDFVAEQQRTKFESLKNFGETFERIDRDANSKLRLPITSKEKVIAVIIRLIIDCGFRAGNSRYARENKTYGTSTLLCKHVDVKGPHVKISFVGKKNVLNESCVTSPLVRKFIIDLKKQCRPDKRLFTYLDDTGSERVVESSDVNVYLKRFGVDVKAKDLRGWVANKLFMQFWPSSEGKNNKEKIKWTISKVAEKLHHTTAVCRKDYLHPDLLVAAEQG